MRIVNNRKKKHSSGMLIAAALTAAMVLSGCANDSPEPIQATNPMQTAATQTADLTYPTETVTDEITMPTVPAEPGIMLPYAVEEWGLEISEFFESSIPNPDTDEELVEDVGSLEVVNNSGRYLRTAFFEVETYDERMFSFRIQDLPADAVVWAFDLSNGSDTGDGRIRSIACTQAEFDDPSDHLWENVAVETNDLTVTVTNNGSETLESLEIICRCDFGGLFFGGVSYSYPVESLAPGEQFTFDALECYMGTAAVVDIRYAE